MSTFVKLDELLQNVGQRCQFCQNRTNLTNSATLLSTLSNICQHFCKGKKVPPLVLSCRSMAGPACHGAPGRCPLPTRSTRPTAPRVDAAKQARRRGANCWQIFAEILEKFRQNFARFRLYRRRSLQENMRFAAFFKIYQII